MEVNKLFFTSQLQTHYKKLLILCTATATLYLIKRYIDRKKPLNMKKEKKKIKEFPKIEEIQKFIEDLPFDSLQSGTNVTLKHLLDELSEFSEDEEWKELIASVHHLYDSGSIMSIYEDPNVISLNGTMPSEENVEIKSINSDDKYEDSENTNVNKGNGDMSIVKVEIETTEESLVKNLGEGDKGDYNNN
ncbi:hypothetical protein ABEB36_007630 [Hypothenemus hampei]|uniref:Uncharacterized protein n=1 Tax=Hypothenemus hampei TaxID=57062 RepID=A0ABD1EUM7_HYPHA